MCEVYGDEDEVYYESYLKGMIKLKEERDEFLSLLREINLFYNTDGTKSSEFSIRTKLEDILLKYKEDS